jgi:hypothetical protein
LKRLLITARDYASANDIKEILPDLVNSQKFIIKIIAQNPAYEVFKKIQTNCFFNKVKIEYVKSSTSIDSNYTAFIFNDFMPHLLLTGISSSVDYGIDEIALKVASKYKNNDHKVRTFSIQSYWGDLNYSLNAVAETIFVLDDFAKRVTLKKCKKCDIVTTGPLQTKKYENINVEQKRGALTQGNKYKNAKIVGFFGQPLLEHDWYKRTIEIFLKELGKLKVPLVVLYKPHPKETIESIKWTENAIKNTHNNFIFTSKSDILDVLPMTDLVVSLFSTVGYDLQNLLAHSSKSFSVPLYLFYEKGCRQWFERYCQLIDIPMSNDGMALVVKKTSELSKMIHLGLDVNFQSCCQKKIKENFHTVFESASNTILKKMCNK